MIQTVYSVHLGAGGLARKLARRLDTTIDGPLLVKRDLRDYLNGQDGAADALWVSLGDEIHRIQHGQIASLAHPNNRGHLSCATAAVGRYLQHRQTMAAADQEVMQGPAPGLAGATRIRTGGPAPISAGFKGRFHVSVRSLPPQAVPLTP